MTSFLVGRLRSGHRALLGLRGKSTRRTLTSSTTLRPRQVGAFAAAEGTKHPTHTNIGAQGKQGARLAPAMPRASARLEVWPAVPGRRDHGRGHADLHRQQPRKLVQGGLAEAVRAV